MNSIFFRYDGTFSGFLTCIYEIYREGISPAGFDTLDGDPTLFPERQVASDPIRARQVYKTLGQRVSLSFRTMIEQGFLTCLLQREMALYELIRRGLTEGDRVRKDLADPTVARVALALRKQVTEVEHLKGFVRFSELDGVLVGEIEPKNRVLPLMAGHFTARFPGEQLMLYDRTHGEALFCHHFRHAILPVEDFHMGPAGETERAIRALWRRYYATAAIEERTNPKCQSAHLPKRYRPVMTEFMAEPDPALGEGQTNCINHILEEESHV